MTTTDSEVYAIEGDSGSSAPSSGTREADPEYRHAGLDIFLAGEHQGQGIGSEVLRDWPRGTCSRRAATTGS